MEIRQVIVKKRVQFGKQCIFDEDNPELLFDILPDPKLKDNWLGKEVYDADVQVSKQFAVHEVISSNSFKSLLSSFLFYIFFICINYNNTKAFFVFHNCELLL